MKKETAAANSRLKISNEIIALALIFLSIFLVLALSGYHPDDPGFFSITARSTRNYAGRLGGFVASLFMSLFGYASFVLVLLSLLYSAYFLTNRQLAHTLSKAFGLLLSLFSLAILLALLFEPAGSRAVARPGGVIGDFFAVLLRGQLKKFVAVIFVLGLFLVSVLIVTKISLRRSLLWLGKSLARICSQTAAFLTGAFRSWRRHAARSRIEKKYFQEQEPQTVPPASPRPSEKVAHQPLNVTKRSREPHPKPANPPEENLLFSDLKDDIRKKSGYLPPPASYLDQATARSFLDRRELDEKRGELLQRLNDFDIAGQIQSYTPGPVITTYEFVPDVGVKIKDVASLTEDLALAVKAQYVRIERILGKNAIGIEIPNLKRETIHLREIIESPYFQSASSPLTLALGKTTAGDIYISDLREMPHLLIAGTTGSGKSVCLHTLILSIIYKASPRSVKFILIDPKHVEMVIYNSLPHLLTNVIVNPQQARNALEWAVNEMEKRYKYLATLQVRNLEQFNKKLELMVQNDEEIENLEIREKLPYIVIIIDELADLMITSAHEVEESITLLAQKARAVGIHLIIATQRPSVDVVTGTIKNNFPSRISFYVPTKTDSRTVIDQVGAEKLLGNGDMLFLPPRTASLIRLHGAFVSESEALRVINYLAKIDKPQFNTQIIKFQSRKGGSAQDDEKGFDEFFIRAAELIISSGQASVTFLQRKMSIGFARAGRVIDQLESAGVISAPNSRNQREILITMEELEQWKESNSPEP